MSRVQLALRVADLDSSVEFYRKLFGVQPAKRRPGYANFAITEPPLKLVLIEGEPNQATVMDHLGIEVESTEQVRAATARLAGQALDTTVEDATTLLRRAGQGVGARTGRRTVGGLHRARRRSRGHQHPPGRGTRFR